MTFKTTKGKPIRAGTSDWYDVLGGRLFDKGLFSQAAKAWDKSMHLLVEELAESKPDKPSVPASAGGER